MNTVNRNGSWVSAALLLASLSTTALARPRPEADVFLASGAERPLVSELSARARAMTELGHVSQVERRLGVPTFFWTGPSQVSSPSLRALGVTPEQAARRYLFDYAELYRFSPAELAEARVSRVHDLGDGAVIVAFEREVNGIPVFRDSLRVAMNQRLEPVALSGYLSPLSAAKAQTTFELGPQAAIGEAFLDLTGARLPASALKPNQTQEGGWQWFDSDNFVAEDGSTFSRPARARRVLFATATELVPAYHLELEVSAPGAGADADFYAYVISAKDGALLFRHTLTSADAFSYRVWASTTDKFPHDGPQGFAGTPHPTGNPDGFQAPFVAPNLVTLQNLPFSKNDPWLPAGATITKGNNANAYADIDATNHFSAGDLQPTATAANTFDRVFNTTLAPKGTQAQTLAATTQLFYDVNFFHDFYYDVGFNEASGNAQDDNFGRGGLGNDGILAEAQDASGKNNANMSTPSDGSRPTMQMFLFDGVPGRTFKVTSPASIAKEYPAGVSTFTTATFNTSGSLVLAVDGTAPVNDGCEALTGAAGTYTGKIVVIDRGLCPFTQKVTNARTAGAAGVLVVNNAAGAPPDMPGTLTGTQIPAMSVSQADGATIKAALAGGAVAVTMTKLAALDRDGTLDNAIVAHEWGHYISNRLVGNSVGLSSQQAVGMGEGMGDFHALLMLVREEDGALPINANWNGVFGASTYVTSGGNNDGYYFGIRRYPYSTNLTKNPLTFKHIANGTALPTTAPVAFGADGANNAEVHNTGEVWATMSWECYAALLRSPRLTFQEAQLRMRQYYVAMYKLAPMAATILEMRDALLAVAYAKDVNDFQAFTQAFAKRGAGLLAKGPDRASSTNTPVTESFITGAELVLAKAELTDDVSGCDKDGFLDNNEIGTLKVTLKNTGWSGLTATTGTVMSPIVGVTFPSGGAITFGPSTVNGTTTGTVRVGLSGFTAVTNVIFNISFNDPGLASPGPRNGSVTIRTNYDVTPAASASDDVEAPATVWTPAAAPALSTAFPWVRESVGPAQTVWYGPNPSAPADTYLVSPPLKVSAAGNFGFTFKHRHEFESQATGANAGNYDGAVLELSTDAGATWTDIGSKASPTYGGTLKAGTENPLTGRAAYVSKSAGYPAFVPVTVSLGTTYAGQTVQVRFRIGADDGTALRGWDIDDIGFTGIDNTPFPKIVVDPNKCLNRAPIADAGANQTVDSGATVTLDGSKSSDPDGDPLTYTWTQTGGAGVTLVGASAVKPTFTAPTVTVDTEYTFQLVVADAKNMSNPATTRVTVRPSVNPTNHQPVANGGGNRTVDSGAEVTLSGTGTDADNDPLTFKWTQTEGPAVQLDSSTIPTPTFTAPKVTSETVLRFELVVNDGKVDSAASAVTLTVKPGSVTNPPKPDPNTPKGCGCGQTGFGALAPFALLALLGLAARRRRA